MATPSSRHTIQESPPPSPSDTVTTEEEEEEVGLWEGQEEWPTTDESIVELRRALYSEGRLSSCDKPKRLRRKTSLNFNTESETSNGKSVVRTLFPSTAAKGGRMGRVLSWSGSRPNPSPLVSSFKRSPSEDVSRIQDYNDDTGDRHPSAACSQDLFGSPVSMVPCSPPCNTKMECSSPPVVGGAPEIVESPSHLNFRTPQVGCPLVHSTPVCKTEDYQTDQHLSEYQRLDNNTSRDKLTRSQATSTSCCRVEATSVVHTPPRVIDDASLGTRSIRSRIGSQDGQSEVGALHWEVRKTGKTRRTSPRSDDVLDVLFMSSSQLEAHFSDQRREGGARQKLPRPSEPVTTSVDETVATTSVNETVLCLDETLIGLSEGVHVNELTGDVGNGPAGVDARPEGIGTVPLNKEPEAQEGVIVATERDILPSVVRNSSVARKQTIFQYPKTRSLNMRKSRIRTREVVKKSLRTSTVVVAADAAGSRLGVPSSSGVVEGGCVVSGRGKCEEQAAGLASPPTKKRLSIMEVDCSKHRSRDQTKKREDRVYSKLKLGNVERRETIIISSETKDVVASDCKAENHPAVTCAHAECGGGERASGVKKVEDSVRGEDCRVEREGGGCVGECDELRERLPVPVDELSPVCAEERGGLLEKVDPVSMVTDNKDLGEAEEEGVRTEEVAKSQNGADVVGVVANNDEDKDLVTLPTADSSEGTSTLGNMTKPGSPVVNSSSINQDELSHKEPVSGSLCNNPAHTSSSPAQKTPDTGSFNDANPIPIITKFIPTESSTRHEFVSFQTAAGSSIAISAAALDKARQLVEEEEFDTLPSSDGAAKDKPSTTDTPDPEANSSGNKTDADQGQISNDSRKPVKDVKFHTPSVKKGPLPRRRGGGYKAPRKASDVPKNEERASVMRLLRGFGVTASSSDLHMGRGKLPTQHVGSSKSASTSRASYALSHNSVGPRPSDAPSNSSIVSHRSASTTVVGFQTAGGEGISVSSKSLLHAEELVSKEWQDADKGTGNETTGNCVSSDILVQTGFSTAGGKDIEVSAIALSRARLKEVEDTDQVHGSVSNSASMAVEGSNSMTTTNDNLRPPKLPDVTTGFKTAGGKGISVSSVSLDKAKAIVSDDLCDGLPQDKRTPAKDASLDIPVPTGFSTAGGKGIGVSAAALNRACLKEAEDMNKVQDGTTSSDGAVIERNDTNTELVQAASPRLPAMTTGFKTAGGKGISVSSIALDKAKAIVTDDLQAGLPQETLLLEHEGPSLSTTVVTGFKTASGRELSVAADTMAQVNTAMTEVEDKAGPLDQWDRGGGGGEGNNYNSSNRTELVTSVTEHGREEVPADKTDACDALCSESMDGFYLSQSYLNTQVVKQFMDVSDEEESLTECVTSPGQNQNSDVGVGMDFQRGQGSVEDGEVLAESPGLVPLEQLNEPEREELSESAIVSHMNLSSIQGLFEDSCSFNVPPSQATTGQGRTDAGDVPATPKTPPMLVADRKSSSPMGLAGSDNIANEHVLGAEARSQERGVQLPAEVAVMEKDEKNKEDELPCSRQQDVPSKPLNVEMTELADDVDGSNELGLVQEGEADTEIGAMTQSSSSHSCTVEEAEFVKCFQEGEVSPTSPDVCHSIVEFANDNNKASSEEKLKIQNKVSKQVVVAAAEAGGDLEQSEVGVGDLMDGIELGDMEMSEDTSRDCGTCAVSGPSEEVISFRGRRTAAGKAVAISEKCRQVAKALLIEARPDIQKLGEVCVDCPAVQDLTELSVDGSNCRGSDLRGFHTASGQRVTVSEESIAAARNALDEVNTTSCQSSYPHNPGKNRKQDILDQPKNTSRTPCNGLQTAGGKSVEISRESRAAARALFGGQPMNHSPVSGEGEFPGLGTASGRKVEVKKQSLLAAKALWGAPSSTERGSCVSANKVSQSSNITLSYSKDGGVLQSTSSRQYPGLHTAAGRHVEITPRSLQAARIALGVSGTSPNAGTLLERSATNVTNSKFNSISSEHEQCSASPCVEVRVETEWSTSHSIGACRKSTSSRLREMQARVQKTKTSLTSIPEGTLCDRNTCLGKRLFPPQSSLPPDVPVMTPPTKRTSHNFNTSHQNTILFRNSSPPRKPHRRNSLHCVNNKDFQLTPAVTDNRRGSSSHNPRLHAPLNTFKSPCVPSASRPTIPCNESSYTAAGRVGFITPMKGKPMGKKLAACPSVWNSQQARSHQQQQQQQRQQRHRNGRPVWLSSTPKASSANSTTFRPTGFNRSRIGSSGSGSTDALHDSSFHITLSQLHDMEESLEFESKCQQSKENVPPPPPKVPDDSGYASREMSTLKSPSPGSATPPPPPPPPPPASSVSSGDPLQMEEVAAHNEEDLTDIIFAEFAMEDLDDSLGQNSSASCNSSPTFAPSDPHSELVLSPVLCPSSLTTKSVSPLQSTTSVSPMDASPPAFSSPASVPQVASEQAASRESPTVPSHGEVQAIAAVSSPTGGGNGVIKPRCGFLLELRRQHARDRKPLIEAVRGQLPHSATSRDHQLLGIGDALLGVSSETAENFRFSSDYFSSNVLRDDKNPTVFAGDGALLQLNRGTAGVEEFWSAFRLSPGVDESLISRGWFVNHYKHLVVKLAAMERSYPVLFSHRSLTPDWLLLQLKYRYDREIDGAERSAIHRMCEHDDVPSRRMVLYVSKVYMTSSMFGNDSTLTTSAAGTSWNGQESTIDETVIVERKQEQQLPSVSLSDGWYDLPCVFDRPLRHMLKTGRIRVGTKLMTYGAELVGLGSPCHPLEAPPSCYLKLSANSTRRARWDTLLGYQRVPAPFPVSLRSLFPDGGLVGKVAAVVARVYPMLYMEKREGGAKSVMRCKRLEERERTGWERERERLVDVVCSRVKTEYEAEVAQQDFPTRKTRRSRRLNTLQVKQLMDGQEIYSALVNAQDPQAIQDLLSAEQRVYLDSYKLSLETERQAELQRRMKAAMEEAEEKSPAQRNVVPLLKLRLVSIGDHLETRGNKELDCQLSIWRPQGELQEIKEGTVMKFSGISATPSKYHSRRLQLTASRSTHYEVVSRIQDKASSSGVEMCSSDKYRPRAVTQLADLSSLSPPPYGEFDTVAMVVHISSAPCPPRAAGDDADGVLDVAYVADNTGVLEVKMYGGAKAYGLEDVLTVGAVVSAINLGYRGTRHGSNVGGGSSSNISAPWPSALLTDISIVSCNPRDAVLRDAFVTFKKQLSGNQDAFLNKMVEEIRIYL